MYSSCLRSWLEQDTSCPTCRQSLNNRPTTDPNHNVADVPEEGTVPPTTGAGNLTTNHFFHFDGNFILYNCFNVHTVNYFFQVRIQLWVLK